MKASIHILIKIGTEPEKELSAVYPIDIKDDLFIELDNNLNDDEIVDSIIGKIFEQRNNTK